MGLQGDVYGGKGALMDKRRRVNASGRTSEPVVKREQPRAKDDKAALESQRRAIAYGRARGQA